MSETVTRLWNRTMVGEHRTFEPTGQFRRIEWCATHDARMMVNDQICMVFYFVPFERSRECRLVEVWQEVTPYA